MAAIGISQSSSLAPDSSKAKTAVASIFSIIDRKSKIDPSDEKGMVLENVTGEIELRHISFSYPSRPDIQIFRDLSLAIHSGKVIIHISNSIRFEFQAISIRQKGFMKSILSFHFTT